MFLMSPCGDHTYCSLNPRKKVQNNHHLPSGYPCMPTTEKLGRLRKNLTYSCRVLYDINYPPRTGDTNTFQTLFHQSTYTPNHGSVYSLLCHSFNSAHSMALLRLELQVFLFLSVSSFLPNFCFQIRGIYIHDYPTTQP